MYQYLFYEVSFALTSGLEVAQDMICSSIPDTHLLLSCVYDNQ